MFIFIQHNERNRVTWKKIQNKQKERQG